MYYQEYLDGPLLINFCLVHTNKLVESIGSKFDKAVLGYDACSNCAKPFEEIMGSCRACGTERPTKSRV